MAVDQDLIDAFTEINTALNENGDWYPDNQTKLRAFVNAMHRALALRPQLMSRGNQGEALRFDLEVSLEYLRYLETSEKSLGARLNAAGGFVSHQRNLRDSRRRANC